MIAPGVAHEDTIRTFHSARFMEDPAAVQCNLEGNPLHEEQLEILRMLGGQVFAVNTVLDEERRTTFVNFGEILESHEQAVDYVRDARASLPVPRRFSTVVTSAAGFPLDATYYQTVKGMVMPIDILAPGADLDHRCGVQRRHRARRSSATPRRGWWPSGPDAFLQQILAKQLRRRRRMADRDAAQAHARRQHPPVHRWAGRGRTVQLTGVNIDRFHRGCRGRRACARSGDPAVAVIPEGPYVVPFHCPPNRGGLTEPQRRYQEP